MGKYVFFLFFTDTISLRAALRLKLARLFLEVAPNSLWRKPTDLYMMLS